MEILEEKKTVIFEDILSCSQDIGIVQATDGSFIIAERDTKRVIYSSKHKSESEIFWEFEDEKAHIYDNKDTVLGPYGLFKYSKEPDEQGSNVILASISQNFGKKVILDFTKHEKSNIQFTHTSIKTLIPTSYYCPSKKHEKLLCLVSPAQAILINLNSKKIIFRTEKYAKFEISDTFYGSNTFKLIENSKDQLCLVVQCDQEVSVLNFDTKELFCATIAFDEEILAFYKSENEGTGWLKFITKYSKKVIEVDENIKKIKEEPFVGNREFFKGDIFEDKNGEFLKFENDRNGEKYRNIGVKQYDKHNQSVQNLPIDSSGHKKECLFSLWIDQKIDKNRLKYFFFNQDTLCVHIKPDNTSDLQISEDKKLEIFSKLGDELESSKRLIEMTSSAILIFKIK